MSHMILFLFICFCSRLCWSWKVPISILRLMKNYVRFQYVPWKNVCLSFISIASVYFSHKIEKFHLELKHNNNKKRNGVTFEYVSWKNVWFCFIPKTDKFYFKSKDIRGIGWKTEARGRGGGGSRFEWKGILKKKVL